MEYNYVICRHSNSKTGSFFWGCLDYTKKSRRDIVGNQIGFALENGNDVILCTLKELVKEIKGRPSKSRMYPFAAVIKGLI